jgi:hypothetical protein
VFLQNLKWFCRNFVKIIKAPVKGALTIFIFLK